MTTITNTFDSGPSDLQETFEQAKERWDKMIGLAGVVDERQYQTVIYRTSTGCPIASGTFDNSRDGQFRVMFGQPSALQSEWLKNL